jgi:phospholipase C
MIPPRLWKSSAIKPALAVSLGAAIAFAVLVGSSGGRPASSATRAERVIGGRTGSYIVPAGIHKIKHVIVIQQENRSFDSYFGTYPHADGIPMKHGKPTVCVIDPASGKCVAPYVDHADVNGGGPHNAKSAVADVNGARWTGSSVRPNRGARAA